MPDGCTASSFSLQMVWVWVVLASLIVQKQVAFAALTVEKHRVSASMVTQEQMALASLMDSAVLDSFQQSSMPSSQMALCLWASMDDLVTNSSSRALLAFSWSSAASVGGVMLPDLVVTAMGEIVVGTPSRDASAILTSSKALTWDEVSTSLGSSFGLWGRGVSTTTRSSLLGVKLPDP